MLLAAAQDEDLMKEYKTRRAAVKDDDINEILKLAEWCNDEGLRDLAEAEWERTLKIDPDHAVAREKLGYVKKDGKWIEDERRETRKRIRLALSGLKLPKERPKPKNEWEKKALDFLMYRENWYTALDTIDKRTGLFCGAFEVLLSFAKIGKGKAMKGFGQNGVGAIQVDLEEFAMVFKSYAEYEEARKNPSPTVVLAPVISPMNLFIREMVHCFMWEKLPPQVVEGIAAYCCDDVSILYQYNQLGVKITPIQECPTDKDQHFGRGYAFFEYVAQKGGPLVLKFVVSRLQNERRDWREIVESSLKKEWADISKDEKEWSEKFLKDYTSNKK
jgi:hypothetical protein